MLGRLEPAGLGRDRTGESPRSNPNSSASSRASGREPQSMTTKGPLARRLCSCSQRASRLLPVPLSPVMTTVASVGATRAASLRSVSSAVEFPMNSSPVTMVVGRVSVTHAG